MSRLVVVSNRVAAINEGKAAAGGLAAGVSDALKAQGGIWFGWSGKTSSNPSRTPERHELGRVTLLTIDLPRKEFDAYYKGFSNGTLWPVLHYRVTLGHYEEADRRGYMTINNRFADCLYQEIEPDDVIWVHDYHLIPLGAALRRKGVPNRIGFFLHTPFPAPEVFKAIPTHPELFQAMLAYDVIGFQTQRDAQGFIDYAQRDAGLSAPVDGHLMHENRRIKVGVYPIGIDVDSITAQARATAGRSFVAKLKRSLAGRRLMISVDRLDYSKGLLRRFHAFRRLLDEKPQFRSNLTFMQIAPPSRGDVSSYRLMREELEGEAGHINGRFAEVDWVPLRYLNRSFPREELMPIYRTAEIGLVTPLRDGMNLVAKEFVAAQDPAQPGVLVLSEFAGAAAELDAAVLVNPFDVGGMANAIARALDMGLEERKERHASMIEVLRRNSLAAWRDRFLGDLAQVA
jgi:trehalose 6-phosphate synthase